MTQPRSTAARTKKSFVCPIDGFITAGSFVVLLTVVSASTVAQTPTGEVNGRIVSARDNQPLALVQVDLVGTPFQSVTGADGLFRIIGLPAGAYVLQTTAVGYRPVRQPFTLDPGAIEQFEVTLTPTTITLSSDVVVQADPFEGSQPDAAAFTLQGDEQKNLASVLADDPLRAVQSAPGVTSNDDFSSEFSVRGAPFRRVGLYLDGVLVHSPFHTTDGEADNGSLAIFSGDLTSAMTLYDGGWPARYGNRTAAIVSVDTRDGSREEFRSQVSLSASNAGFSAEGPLGRQKRGALLVAVRKSYLQYILNRIDFGDQPPLAFGFTDGQARIDYDLTPRYALSFDVLSGSSSVDRSRFQNSLGPNALMASAFRSTILNLGLRSATPHLLLTTHLAWSRETGHVDNRERLALSDQTYDEGTLRSDGTLVPGRGTQLDFGGEIHHVRQEGLTTQVVYAPDLTRSVDAIAGATQRAGAYAEESVSFHRCRVAGGARVDEHGLIASPVMTLNALTSCEPSPKTSLRFESGQYVQFPELDQVLSTFAVRPLLPERATHYQAAVEQRLNERTRLRVEAYDREDRDLLARPALDPRRSSSGAIIDADARAPLGNSERGHARGAQILVQRRTANGFTGWVSYAIGHTVVTDTILKQTFPSDYDQRHTINAYVSRRLRPTVNVSGRFTYGSGMPLPGFYRLDNGGFELAQARNGLRAPVYERADLRLNKELVRRTFDATLFLEVVNVTSHANRDFDTPGAYDPSTGRTVPNFYSMFPILPSAGMVVTFGRPHVHSG